MSHLKSAPLKILLVDSDYNEYLLFKNLFSPVSDLCVGLLWCGECERVYRAIQSGFYDLVLMNPCEENLLSLAYAVHDGCQTPVVMLADEMDDTQMRCAMQNGALGVLDRRHPELCSLKGFLLRAGAQQSAQEFTRGFLAEPTCPVDDNLVLQ